MTLIKDEFPEAEPEHPGEAATSSAKPAGQHKPVVSIILGLVVVVLLLGASGILLYFAFSSRDETPVVAETPLQEPVEAVAPVVAEEMEVPPVSVIEPFPSSSDIQGFIKSLQISGIRVSDTGNRAIINGRMYAVGDRLPTAHRLQLVEIAPGQLTFTDANRVSYRRRF